MLSWFSRHCLITYSCIEIRQFNRMQEGAAWGVSAASLCLFFSAKTSSQTFETFTLKSGENDLTLWTLHNTYIKIRCSAVDSDGLVNSLQANFSQCTDALKRGSSNAVLINCKQLPRWATLWAGFCLLYASDTVFITWCFYQGYEHMSHFLKDKPNQGD